MCAIKNERELRSLLVAESTKDIDHGVRALVQVYDLGEQEVKKGRYLRLSVYLNGEGRPAYRTSTVVQRGATVDVATARWGRTVFRSHRVVPRLRALSKALEG